MKIIGLSSKIKKKLCVTSRETAWNLSKWSYHHTLTMDWRGYMDGPPSPDIDLKHIRLRGLGLANNALAPDLPCCAAARSTVVLSQHSPWHGRCVETVVWSVGGRVRSIAWKSEAEFWSTCDMTIKYLIGENIKLLGQLSLWQCFGLERQNVDKKYHARQLLVAKAI